MWVTGGCSGVFLYNDMIGLCTTGSDNYKRCPINNMYPDKFPSKPLMINSTDGPTITTVPQITTEQPNDALNGFIKKTTENLSLVKDNGKCTSGNYGFHGTNKIFAKNGCKGVFRLGGLVGRCNALEVGDKPTQKTDMNICSIGWVDNIDGIEQGLVLGRLLPHDNNPICRIGNKYGFKDNKTAYRDISYCTGDLAFGEMTVGCNDNNSECVL